VLAPDVAAPPAKVRRRNPGRISYHAALVGDSGYVVLTVSIYTRQLLLLDATAARLGWTCSRVMRAGISILASIAEAGGDVADQRPADSIGRISVERARAGAIGFVVPAYSIRAEDYRLLHRSAARLGCSISAAARKAIEVVSRSPEAAS
jgi:hypothetical protein